VSEVTGQCGGGVRLSWLGKITDAINIPAGGSRDVLLDFEVPCRPTDIEVSLIDEVRHFTVGSRIVSITPSLPDLDISDFNIPELRPEVCSGTSLVGSILIKALNCTQEVRGRIFDGTSGEVFASFGPETLNPGETIEPRFSFTVPHRMIPLKYTVERRTIEGWASVKTFSLDIKNIEPITKVGPLVAPDRMCAGIIIEPFINVIAERCPQTVRARLVDEATGEEIQPYGEIELESGGSATRKFPFRMPWKGVGIRAEVDRFDTVNEGWNRIEVVGEKIEQKTPATGVITGREVAAWARPGYPTTGSVMVRNDGECAGDIRVEGFIAEKGIMSETYTLASGESRTSVYSAMMPPIAMAGLLFRVSSMREKDFVETSSTVDVISAARAVLLEEGAAFINGGDEPYSYAGVVIARNVEWRGPRPVEEGTQITSMRPLEGMVKPYVFAGRVEPDQQNGVSFDSGSLVYLKMVTGVRNSWCIHGTLQNKDTDVMSYSKIGTPLVAAQSKLAGMTLEDLKKVARIG